MNAGKNSKNWDSKISNVIHRNDMFADFYDLTHNNRGYTQFVSQRFFKSNSIRKKLVL